MVGAARQAIALAGLIAASLAAPAASGAEALSVVGACRGGAPNGAYELHGPDGRLRAVGAFAAHSASTPGTSSTPAPTAQRTSLKPSPVL